MLQGGFALSRVLSSWHLRQRRLCLLGVGTNTATAPSVIRTNKEGYVNLATNALTNEESMTKQGQPSRAEISDAAFGVRSECVMLNKGPYIVETVRFLSGVLGRMSTHHAKRRPMMRRLAVADRKTNPCNDVQIYKSKSDMISSQPSPDCNC